MIQSIVLPANPVKNHLIVESINKITSFIQYSILDITGKVIIPETVIEFCEGIIKISIDSLQKGLYILHISDKDSYVVNSFEVA